MTTEAVHDQLAIYDYAVTAWVESAPFETVSGKFMSVFGNPDRAFASMADILSSRGVATTARTVPLPFASISRMTGFEWDQARTVGPQNRIRNLGPIGDGWGVKQADWPAPYDFEYRIEVWAKTRETLNRWEVWSLLQFKSFERFLKVDFSSLDSAWGTKLIPMRNRGILDSSAPESDETQERIIRATQTIVLKGWLFPAVSRVPVVKKVRADFYTVPNGVSPAEVSTQDIAANPADYPQVGQVVVP